MSLFGGHSVSAWCENVFLGLRVKVEQVRWDKHMLEFMEHDFQSHKTRHLVKKTLNILFANPPRRIWKPQFPNVLRTSNIIDTLRDILKLYSNDLIDIYTQLPWNWILNMIYIHTEATGSWNPKGVLGA